MRRDAAAVAGGMSSTGPVLAATQLAYSKTANSRPLVSGSSAAVSARSGRQFHGCRLLQDAQFDPGRRGCSQGVVATGGAIVLRQIAKID
jgi:hypothetical protein